jgi:hypothetical protein
MKSADGFQRFIDTGEKVFKGMVKPPEKDEAPLTIADRTILNNFVTKFGALEGANKFSDYKQNQKVQQNVAISGEGGVKPKDISTMIDDWQAFSKPLVDSINQIDKMREMAIMAQEGNATAYVLNNRELIKLVGDAQISTAEVNDMLHTGSISERIASSFTMWIAGKPTETKTEDIMAILDVIGPRLRQVVNDKRGRLKLAYSISGVPTSATDAVFGDDYDLGSSSAEEEMIRRGLK